MKNNFEQNKSVKSNIIYVFIDASNLWQAQNLKGKCLTMKN